jgi:diadenosine tetraphosphate (Ap4A) HIT family hydrolase
LDALQSETASESVYLYAFEHPHLHFHLAPHRDGDALSNQIIKGTQIVQQVGGGLKLAASPEFPALPQETHLQTAARVRERLARLATT